MSDDNKDNENNDLMLPEEMGIDRVGGLDGSGLSDIDMRDIPDKKRTIVAANRLVNSCLYMEKLVEDLDSGEPDLYIYDGEMMRRAPRESESFFSYLLGLGKSWSTRWRDGATRGYSKPIRLPDGGIVMDKPKLPSFPIAIEYFSSPASRLNLHKNILLYTGAIDRLPTNLIKLGKGNNLYWDKKKAELIELDKTDQVNRRKCYISFFDTDYGDSNIIKLDTSKLDGKKIALAAKKMKANLEETDGGKNGNVWVPEELRFIEQWADGKNQRYLELLKLTAIPFLEEIPIGFYYLGGFKSRNGKSCYNYMVKTMLGRNNSTSLDYIDLSDWSQNNALKYSKWNCPDEATLGDNRSNYRGAGSESQSLEYLKQLSSGSSIMVNVKGSSKPLLIEPNFPIVFPLNKEPNFNGMEDDGLLNRMVYIPFEHHFGKEDVKSGVGIGFCESTYTIEMYNVLLGALMGLVQWSKEKGVWEHSEEALSYRQKKKEQTLNLDIFIKELTGVGMESGEGGEGSEGWTGCHYHFIQNFKLFEGEYEAWCNANGYEMESKEKVKNIFNKYFTRKHFSWNNNGVPGKIWLYEYAEADMFCPGYCLTNDTVVAISNTRLDGSIRIKPDYWRSMDGEYAPDAILERTASGMVLVENKVSIIESTKEIWEIGKLQDELSRRNSQKSKRE